MQQMMNASQLYINVALVGVQEGVALALHKDVPQQTYRLLNGTEAQQVPASAFRNSIANTPQRHRRALRRRGWFGGGISMPFFNSAPFFARSAPITPFVSTVAEAPVMPANVGPRTFTDAFLDAPSGSNLLQQAAAAPQRNLGTPGGDNLALAADRLEGNLRPAPPAQQPVRTARRVIHSRLAANSPTSEAPLEAATLVDAGRRPVAGLGDAPSPYQEAIARIRSGQGTASDYKMVAGTVRQTLGVLARTVLPVTALAVSAVALATSDNHGASPVSLVQFNDNFLAATRSLYNAQNGTIFQPSIAIVSALVKFAALAAQTNYTAELCNLYSDDAAVVRAGVAAALGAMPQPHLFASATSDALLPALANTWNQQAASNPQMRDSGLQAAVSRAVANNFAAQLDDKVQPALSEWALDFSRQFFCGISS